MKNNDNIEILFKETFERFEADVNPKVWSNIENGIKPGQGNFVHHTVKSLSGKIILGVASIAIISGSIWYLSSSTSNPKTVPSKQQIQTETIISSKEFTQNNISETQPINTTNSFDNTNTHAGSSMPPAVRSLNHYSSDNIQQTQTVSEKTLPDKTPSDGSVTKNTENTPSQPISHKYGKSSDEPTSLIRGNLKQNAESKSSTKNSPEENHNAEQVPNANILASSESGDAPLSVNFSNQDLPSSLNWDFGDGSTSRENTPSHTFKKAGNYVVHLTSKNSLGNSTDKITIEVKSISDIAHIPNVFSPNGDGENDLFFFDLKNIASIEVVISDLNAHIVGGWNSLDGSWNGKLRNGDDAPEGLYFYTIVAIGTDGVNHTQKGSISLSRKR